LKRDLRNVCLFLEIYYIKETTLIKKKYLLDKEASKYFLGKDNKEKDLNTSFNNYLKLLENVNKDEKSLVSGKILVNMGDLFVNSPSGNTENNLA
jgi:hypothetical protein